MNAGELWPLLAVLNPARPIEVDGQEVTGLDDARFAIELTLGGEQDLREDAVTAFTEIAALVRDFSDEHEDMIGSALAELLKNVLEKIEPFE